MIANSRLAKEEGRARRIFEITRKFTWQRLMAKNNFRYSNRNCNKTGVVIGWDEYKFDQYQTTDKYERTITFYLLEAPPNCAEGPVKLPLFVYINGSGGGSVFAPAGERFVGSKMYENYLRPSAGRARLLLVEKPGVSRKFKNLRLNSLVTYRLEVLC